MPIAVPVPQPIAVPIDRPCAVPVPQPIAVPVDRPYPVPVPVSTYASQPVVVHDEISIPVSFSSLASKFDNPNTCHIFGNRMKSSVYIRS